MTLLHSPTLKHGVYFLMVDSKSYVTDFMLIFPRVLRWFGWLEPHFSRLPIGAQNQVLARKPASE
jgi:hypothetical protein